jgi:hypothetical protein
MAACTSPTAAPEAQQQQQQQHLARPIRPGSAEQQAQQLAAAQHQQSNDALSNEHPACDQLKATASSTATAHITTPLFPTAAYTAAAATPKSPRGNPLPQPASPRFDSPVLQRLASFQQSQPSLQSPLSLSNSRSPGLPRNDSATALHSPRSRQQLPRQLSEMQRAQQEHEQQEGMLEVGIASRGVPQLALVPSPVSAAGTSSERLLQQGAASKLRSLSNASSSASSALAADMAVGALFEAQVQQRQEVGPAQALLRT